MRRALKYLSYALGGTGWLPSPESHRDKYGLRETTQPTPEGRRLLPLGRGGPSAHLDRERLHCRRHPRH